MARKLPRNQIERIQRAARTTRIGSLLPLKLTYRLYGGSDKYQHGYLDFYTKHVGSRRWLTNRILEIGVGAPHGNYKLPAPAGSLRVWRDFFLFSKIVGFDIEQKDVRLGPRVSFVRGDQSVATDLARAVDALGGPPDIVIDDGSHLACHAEASFRYLFPLMPAGAIYVIEDLHTSYWPEFGGSLPPPTNTAVGFTKSLVDSVQANDVTFDFPSYGSANRPPGEFLKVAAISVYPGITFIEKAAR